MYFKNLGNLNSAIDNFKTHSINGTNSSTLLSAFNEKTAQDIITATSAYNLSSSQQQHLILQYASDSNMFNDIEQVRALSAAQAKATTTTGKLSSAYKGLAASLGLTTSTLTLFLGVAAAAAGIYFISQIKSESEKLKKNALESSQAYSDLQSEISSVNGELEGIQRRIDELNSKDKLTFIEQAELERLEKATAQLESQKAAKQYLAAKQPEEVTETYFFVNHFKGGYYDNIYKKLDQIKAVKILPDDGVLPESRRLFR